MKSNETVRGLVDFKENIIFETYKNKEIGNRKLFEERIKNVICVVHGPKDVFAFEKMKEFHGVYHVLNGYISPSKGKGFDDINLASLISRIENETIEEVILATDLTMEGEITAMYISKLLSKFENLTVTRLAHGLPMGAQLDYADEMTLFKAFSNRKIL